MTEKRMTDEQRNELLGLLPFNQGETIPFTPPCLKKFPEEFRPVFTLKPMSDPMKKRVLKAIKNIKNEADETFREFARQHVTGWENVYDLGTKEIVPFESAEDGGTKKELFIVIPSKPCGEILQYLCRISGLWSAETEALSS